MICDAHVHFFSPAFFDKLGAQLGLPAAGRPAAVVARAGWQDPESVDALADRWAAELDSHGVSRAALIASVPGDETSVARPSRAIPRRFVGFFMLDPRGRDAPRPRPPRPRQLGLRGICLFPGDAPLPAARRPRGADRVGRRGATGHGGVRALRRALGRRAQEARAAQPRSTSGFGNPLDVARGWRSRFRRCRSSFRTSAPASSARR